MCVEVTGIGQELREAGRAGMLVFAKNLGFSFSERKTPPEHFELRSHDRTSLTHSYPEVCLWLITQMSSFGGWHRPFCALSRASWQVGGCRERGASVPSPPLTCPTQFLSLDLTLVPPL